MHIVIYSQISIPTNFYSVTSRLLKSNYKVHKKACSVHLSFKERGKNEKFCTLDSPDMCSEFCKPTNFIIFQSLYKVTFGRRFLMENMQNIWPEPNLSKRASQEYVDHSHEGIRHPRIAASVFAPVGSSWVLYTQRYCSNSKWSLWGNCSHFPVLSHCGCMKGTEVEGSWHLCTLRRFPLVELISLTLGQELVKEKVQLLLQAVCCGALLLTISLNQWRVYLSVCTSMRVAY